MAVRSLLPEWEMNHVILAEQARVALGDEVGALYAATATLMLLGERPGCSPRIALAHMSHINQGLADPIQREIASRTFTPRACSMTSLPER